MAVIFQPSDPNDCTTDFNEAVQQAVLDGSRQLYIPPGSYYFRSLPAKIHNNINIFGVHRSVSVLVYEPDVIENGNFLEIDCRDALGGSIKNLSINGKNPMSIVNAIYMHNTYKKAAAKF